MFIAVGTALAGIIGVADPIKDSTVEAIRTLHDEGIRIVMLSVDLAQDLDRFGALEQVRQLMSDVRSPVFAANVADGGWGNFGLHCSRRPDDVEAEAPSKPRQRPADCRRAPDAG